MNYIRCMILALTTANVAFAGTVSGKVAVSGVRDARNVVVFFEAIRGKTFAPPSTPVVLDQINLTFVPHVLPVVAGTVVAFPNSDEIRHNVFSPSPAGRFSLGSYATGITKHNTFAIPGVYTLLCNVHAEMSAYVIVTETPYFAVTNPQGEFVIKNVPPGKYVVKTWHERLKSQSAPVEIRGDETVSLDFKLVR